MELSKDVITDFSFGWLSAGFNFQNIAFNFLKTNDSTFNVTKEYSQNYNLNVQYTYYNWSSFESCSWYLNFGISNSYGDNLTNLKKSEVSVTNNYGTNPGDTSISEKYFVYQGDYISQLSKLKLNLDFFFFLKGNSEAFHLFPTYFMTEKVKPVLNIGLGLFLSFKAKDSKSANVNTELFYNFLDIYNTGGSSKGFFDRHNVGIQLAVPLNFIIK